METVSYPSRWAVQCGVSTPHLIFDGASRPDLGYVIRKKEFGQQIAVAYPHPHLVAMPEMIQPFSPLTPPWYTGTIDDRLLPCPRAYRPGSLPAWHFPHTLLSTHDGSVAVKVFVIDPTNRMFCERNDKRIRGYHNSDADEVWFVYEESGMCLTELGYLSYGRGDYLYIPKGFLYEFCPDLTSRTTLVGLESKEALLKPVFGMPQVPYSDYSMVPPCPLSEPYFYSGTFGSCAPYVVAVKRFGVWSLMKYDKNPLEKVLGYSQLRNSQHSLFSAHHKYPQISVVLQESVFCIIN